MVLIQHLVLEGSLDATMAHTLIAKQAVIDAALDTDTGYTPEEATMPLVPVLSAPRSEQVATASLSRKQVLREAPALSEEELAQIHTGLCQLAAWCDGARRRDGYGFNKCDTAIGTSLANAPLLSPRQGVLGRKLCQRYRRQLLEVGLALAEK